MVNSGLIVSKPEPQEELESKEFSWEQNSWLQLQEDIATELRLEEKQELRLTVKSEKDREHQLEETPGDQPKPPPLEEEKLKSLPEEGYTGEGKTMSQPVEDLEKGQELVSEAHNDKEIKPQEFESLQKELLREQYKEHQELETLLEEKPLLQLDKDYEELEEKPLLLLSL